MKKTILNNSKGFSLVELCFALFIFSVGILGVTSMQFLSMQGTSQASIVSEATFLAERKAEELGALDFANAQLVDADGDGAAGLADGLAAAGPAPFGFDNNNATLPDADFMETPENPFFRIFWNVDDVTANSKMIQVIVRWVGPNASRRSDATVTFIKLTI